jgi:hypothetical protein
VRALHWTLDTQFAPSAMDSGVRFGRNAFFASAAFITQTPPALALTDRDDGTCKFQKKAPLYFTPNHVKRTCILRFALARSFMSLHWSWYNFLHLSLICTKTRQGFQQAVYAYAMWFFRSSYFNFMAKILIIKTNTAILLGLGYNRDKGIDWELEILSLAE